MVAVGPGVAGSAGVRSRTRCRFRWSAGPAGPATGAGFRPSGTGSGWRPAGHWGPGDRDPVPGTLRLGPQLTPPPPSLLAEAANEVRVDAIGVELPGYQVTSAHPPPPGPLPER